MSQGADFSAKDKHGRTAAHYAAAHGHTPVLEFLSTRGVDLDAEDAKGRGPLHYAALSACSAVDAGSSRGSTNAARCGPGVPNRVCAGDHAAVVELLCSKGCWVDAPDGADNTPLHLAARGLPPGVDAQAALAGDGPDGAGAPGLEQGLQPLRAVPLCVELYIW